MKNRPKPNFSTLLPKNGNYDSIKRMAKEYGFICETYEEFGEQRVGIWEKVNLHP